MVFSHNKYEVTRTSFKPRKLGFCLNSSSNEVLKFYCRFGDLQIVVAKIAQNKKIDPTIEDRPLARP